MKKPKKTKWRIQRLPNGNALFRLTGQRDVNKATMVVVKKNERGMYNVLQRGSGSWDFIGTGKNLTKKEAMAKGKRFMETPFSYAHYNKKKLKKVA